MAVGTLDHPLLPAAFVPGAEGSAGTRGLWEAKRKLDLEGPGQPCRPEFRTPKGKGRTLAQVPSPRTPKSPGEKTRYDTSLGLLTKKFIHLLSESADGVLDLNRAAEVLEVQKRRIYDITNVLEGIQLIRKKSKNHIQWMGTGIFEDTSVTVKQQVLRDELAELAKTERTLDQLLQDCALQLKQLTDDEANQRLAYVTYQDLRAISNFQEQTVIAVKAPPETRLEVPDFSEGDKSSGGQPVLGGVSRCRALFAREVSCRHWAPRQAAGRSVCPAGDLGAMT
nr:PREDICTED: transcription factor E2F2 [Struthio camelus australis]